MRLYSIRVPDSWAGDSWNLDQYNSFPNSWQITLTALESFFHPDFSQLAVPQHFEFRLLLVKSAFIDIASLLQEIRWNSPRCPVCFRSSKRSCSRWLIHPENVTLLSSAMRFPFCGIFLQVPSRTEAEPKIDENRNQSGCLVRFLNLLLQLQCIHSSKKSENRLNSRTYFERYYKILCSSHVPLRKWLSVIWVIDGECNIMWAVCSLTRIKSLWLV